MRGILSSCILVSCLALASCAGLKGSYPIPIQHPEKVEERPICSGCHDQKEFPYARFDHTTYFEQKHMNEARQDEKVCTMCHEQSFCDRCHSQSSTRFVRGSPHWGDYLSRHRIDGRVDPAPCFRCHGDPKSTKRCATCHGRVR